MTDRQPTPDFDSPNGTGRPDEGLSTHNMVADQSGQGGRQSRKDATARRQRQDLSGLEQRLDGVLETTHEAAAMNSRKEEERQRVEFGRRDANSVASRTRASKRVLGKQTSADEDEHGREGPQEHSQNQQAAGSEEDRATKSGEQRSVREKERSVREDPQSVREERLTQNVGQRQVRGIAQEVIMTRDLFEQAQEFEDKLTEEDLREAGWSRDDVVLAMKMLFGEAEEVPEEEQDRLLHGMELVEREKRERRAREQEERERERESKEKERERQVRAAKLARFKSTVVPWGRARSVRSS